MRCCVASCKTNKISKTTKISLFGIPKTDALRIDWEKALGVRFKASSRVCRDHFKEADVIDTWVSGKGLTKYTISLKKPTLRKGAIPIPICNASSISQNFDSSIAQIKVPKEFEVLVSNVNNDHCYYSGKSNTTKITSPSHNDTLSSPENNDHCYYSGKGNTTEITSPSHNDTLSSPENNDHCYYSGKGNTTEITSPSHNDTKSSPERIEVRPISYFKDISNQIDVLNIPTKWYYDKHTTKKLKIISFHKLGPFRDDFTRSIEKQLILTEDLQLLLFVYDKKITISDIGHNSEVNTVITYEKLLSILKQFDETLVCQGALPKIPFDEINSSYGYQFVESYGIWRHIKCCTIVSKDNSKNSNICVWCKRLWYIIRNRKLRLKNNKTIRVFFSPNQQKKLKQIKAQKFLMNKKYSRATKRITFLQNKLKELKKKTKEISQSRLEELLDQDRLNMSMYQPELMSESDD